MTTLKIIFMPKKIMKDLLQKKMMILKIRIWLKRLKITNFNIKAN